MMIVLQSIKASSPSFPGGVTYNGIQLASYSTFTRGSTATRASVLLDASYPSSGTPYYLQCITAGSSPEITITVIEVAFAVQNTGQVGLTYAGETDGGTVDVTAGTATPRTDGRFAVCWSVRAGQGAITTDLAYQLGYIYDDMLSPYAAFDCAWGVVPFSAPCPASVGIATANDFVAGCLAVNTTDSPYSNNGIMLRHGR